VFDSVCANVVRSLVGYTYSYVCKSLAE